MIYIAHRGNLSGKRENFENTRTYIDLALFKGYECEIDICKWDGKDFYLGHDTPQEAISETWIRNKRLWCHAKNYEAFQALQKQGHNCFWHNEDKYTLTSHGYIWAYPGEQVGANTIAVLPEWKDTNIKDAAGICSDNIKFYKDFFEDNNMDTEWLS